MANMVGSVEQIERDLAALEKAVMAIAQDFRQTYTDYLTVLEQTMRQQLTLAAYRLCTQGYPERFLELSFQQRQRLQQSIQQLGKQAHDQLLVPLIVTAPLKNFENATEGDTRYPSEPFGEEFLTSKTVSRSQVDQIDQPDSNLEDPDLEEDPDPEEDLLDEMEASLDFDQPMSPELLEHWQQSLEQNTAHVLQTISHAANRLLQQADILPQQIPDPTLEVVAKSGIVAETAGMPNLLSLLVESEEHESKVRHIVAIRLRLAEIEFGDSVLTQGRSKIRSLSARLHQLEREYRKKQRERSIAEAEAAWRSSWYEA
jgi:hypothetical protein